MVFFLIPFRTLSFLLFFIFSTNFCLNSLTGIALSFFADEVSFFIVYITCFVIFISFIICTTLFSLELNLVFMFMFLVCCVVFVTNNMFILYVSYEASLLPILYIIIKWGSYPERSISSVILLLYTSIFTLPFVYVLFNLYFVNHRFLFSFYYQHTELSLVFSIIIFLTFAVKLPIYGLHF